MRLSFALAGVVCALAFGEPAVAQESSAPMPGRVSARSFHPLPTPLVIRVEPWENTDDNMAIARKITETAAARGIKIAGQDTPFALRFDSEVRPNASPPERDTLSRDRGTPAAIDRERQPLGTPNPDNEVTNLLSSSRNSVLGRRRDEANYGRALRYVINATVDDLRDGKRLWQGNVSYDTAESDRAAVLAGMVPYLVEQIGKALQQRRFTME